MFILAVFLAFCYLILAVFIDIIWFNEIVIVFGTFFAYFFIIFVALIPGFIFTFNFFIFLLNEKKGTKNCLNYPKITILIPMFNSYPTILETIKSISKQKYPEEIIIKIIDDGGKCACRKALEESYEFIFVDELIVASHKGKFNALNLGLKTVDTEYVITIDSDTYLHEDAVLNIVREIMNSNYVAVAGNLLVKNNRETFITKIQEWDYTIGIFGIKWLQSLYNSTLVAQGAFSIYRTDIIKSLDGWTNHLGEDIILTWRMLNLGYKTGYASNALAFTEVPISLSELGIQRKRWARGMIEAFKVVKNIFWHKASIKVKFLIFLNLFFPLIDIANLMFYPLGIILLLSGRPLFIGLMTIVLIPVSLSQMMLMNKENRKSLSQIKYKPEKRSKLAFIIYLLFYNLLLAPYCLSGYFSEILNLKKSWGSDGERKEFFMKSKAITTIIILILTLVFGVSMYYDAKASKKPIESLTNVNIPILLYHDVALELPLKDPYNYEYITTVANLEENIQTFINSDYEIITVRELYDIKQKNLDLPTKPLIITFDDGLISNYELVFPLISKYQVKVGMAITTSLVGTHDDATNRTYFSLEAAKEMQTSGLVEFYSHGKNHIFYENISLANFKSEVIESINIINTEFGDKIDVFVYPYGSYNSYMTSILANTDIAIQIYNLGINNYNDLNFEELKRINIPYGMSGKDIIHYLENYQ